MGILEQDPEEDPLSDPPEIPKQWVEVRIRRLSAEVWEDHLAAREGAAAGVTIAVSNLGNG